MNVKFLGFVQCGFQSPANDYLEDVISLDKYLISNEPATFYLRVTGDSMIDAFIPSGSLLMIDRSMNYKNGTIVLAVIDGDFTVKRYEQQFGKVRLLPENKDFKPIEIHEFTDFKVWGVVKHIIINAKTV